MARFKDKNRFYLLLASIGTNVLLLAFFKYIDFIIEIVNIIFSSELQKLNLALPIGISFYTFQIMSYIIDVYRGKTKPNPKYLEFIMYVSMFPQLIAGPIIRYTDVEKSLSKREFNLVNLNIGTQRFTIGLAKKMLLADNLNLMYLSLIGSNISQIGAILAYIAYGLHIYFDFSAYSDMAIGLGKILGFDFLENFNYPYISKSISEFFRRWHISLGNWFKDYVYIPLKGSRCNKSKMVFNLFLVWFITGLWHGASINYILWGLFLSFFVILEKLFIIKFKSKLIAHSYVLIVIILSWVIFANEDISNIIFTYKTMVGIDVDLINYYTLFEIRNYLVIFTISIIGATPVLKNKLSKLPEYLKSVLLLMLFVICLAQLTFINFSPFIYFRF
jgi:alginate O-acetyltransferase complex protein AlgI